ARGAAAADVQRLEVLRAFHLIVTCRPRHLLDGVEELTNARAPDGVPGPDEPAARVDRGLTPQLDDALFDGLPALAGLRDAEVIDGHVLAGREAIVGLDAVDSADIRDAGTLPGVSDGRADVREHVLAVL